MIKFILFEYECSVCGISFAAPVYTHGYGKFLMRNTKGNDLAFLNALKDKTYQEFSVLLRSKEKIIDLSEMEQSNIFQRLVGYAYDSNTGGHFSINIDPYCNRCGSNDAKNYKEIVPNQYVELEVSTPSNYKWKNMTTEQKGELIDDLLKKHYPNL